MFLQHRSTFHHMLVSRKYVPDATTLLIFPDPRTIITQSLFFINHQVLCYRSRKQTKPLQNAKLSPRTTLQALLTSGRAMSRSHQRECRELAFCIYSPHSLNAEDSDLRGTGSAWGNSPGSLINHVEKTISCPC